jgi:type IV secretory pathway TrbD component
MCGRGERAVSPARVAMVQSPICLIVVSLMGLVWCEGMGCSMGKMGVALARTAARRNAAMLTVFVVRIAQSASQG